MEETLAAKRINYLRMEGFTVSEQVKVSGGRNKQWVLQTHKILKMEVKIVKAYFEDKLTRNLALELSAMAPTQRLKVFEEAVEKSGP